jgi:hypothetical protein
MEGAQRPSRAKLKALGKGTLVTLHRKTAASCKIKAKIKFKCTFKHAPGFKTAVCENRFRVPARNRAQEPYGSWQEPDFPK